MIIQIAQDADKLFGCHGDNAIYIDETGVHKKGKMSVGVANQWCGQLGKTDNCQVGVFAALGHDRFSTPIDFRLDLPSEWAENKKRCQKAKVPHLNIYSYEASMSSPLRWFLHATKRYWGGGNPLAT